MGNGTLQCPDLPCLGTRTGPNPLRHRPQTESLPIGEYGTQFPTAQDRLGFRVGRPTPPSRSSLPGQRWFRRLQYSGPKPQPGRHAHRALPPGPAALGTVLEPPLDPGPADTPAVLTCSRIVKLSTFPHPHRCSLHPSSDMRHAPRLDGTNRTSPSLRFKARGPQEAGKGRGMENQSALCGAMLRRAHSAPLPRLLGQPSARVAFPRAWLPIES